MSALYLVADCAREPRIYDLVHDALFPMCLFRTEVVSPLGRAAPYLVPAEHAERLMAAWRKQGTGQAWGLFMHSSEDQARLRQRLRTFNQAKLPDGQTVLFRWWDPRVFRIYLPTCDADDLRQWFGSVDAYLCEDAEGDGFVRYRMRDGALIEEPGVGWDAL